MDAAQGFIRRGRGAFKSKLSRQARGVHQVLEPPFGFRAFGMATARRGLHPAARRQKQDRLTRRVPKRAFVKAEAGGHAAVSPASSAERMVCTSALVMTRGGDRMMFGPDTRTIAPSR